MRSSNDANEGFGNTTLDSLCKIATFSIGADSILADESPRHPSVAVSEMIDRLTIGLKINDAS